MAKLNSNKWKKSSFYEEKSLVGLTPDQNEDKFSNTKKIQTKVQ